MGCCRPASSGYQGVSISKGHSNLTQTGVKITEGRVTG